jgi:hypothetical protein
MTNEGKETRVGTPRPTGRDDAVNQTHRECFFGAHGTPSQDQGGRAGLANEAWQPNRAAVDQRDAADLKAIA